MGRKSNFPLEPSLVYCYDKYQTFCSLCEPHKIYRRRIAALSGDSKIVAHSCGWLLLSNQQDTHFSLWNPTISDSCSFIHLPPLSFNPDSEISHYLLSSPPGDPDCKVLLLDRVLGSIIFIRPDDPHKEWTQIQYEELLPPDSEGDQEEEEDTEGEEEDDEDTEGEEEDEEGEEGEEEDTEGEETINFLDGCVSCNGKLYGFTCSFGKLLTLSIDNANKLVIESVCKMPDRPTSTVGYELSRASDHLVECCGELLDVHLEFSGSKGNQLIEAHVFKFDSVGMVWKRAESLMGQAVFLDAIGASSFNPALFGKGIQADSLYFTHFNGRGFLYNFNVTDGSTSATLPCPSVPSCFSSPPKIFVPPDVWLSRNNTLPCGKEEQAQDFDEKEDCNIVQAEGTHFLDLPLETLVLIANCLNPFDYLNFRATCRDCRLIPRLQQRQALQMFKTCHYSSSPMWMLHSINDMTAFKFIDPIHGTSFIMNVPESLKGCAVRYSRNGWLLMSDRESSMFFINLFTEEIIKLPETPTQACASSYAMAFSSLPTSPDCIVVGSMGFCGFPFTDTTSELRIAVITMGGLNEWTEDGKVRDAIFWFNNSSPVFYKGSFYFLDLEGKLSVLKYEEEEIDLEFHRTVFWDILKKPKIPCRSFCQNFLLECDGKLMSIFVGQTGKWLQVYSLDFTSMCWEKVESIGNYVIYVSLSSSSAIQARVIGTNNRIYFSRFCDNGILYYSLETRKFHIDGQGTVENFYNTSELILATWIEPPSS